MIGWFDCSSGISGDMMLGALVDAGAPLETMQQAVDSVAPEPVVLAVSDAARSGLRATKVDVAAPETATHRTWRDIRAMLDSASLEPEVREVALRAFASLAEAEARVHGTSPDDVHFHEVGGLDAIADVVGAAAGIVSLGLSSITAGPVAVGSGTVQTRHGRLPVPAPAVVELLRDVPTHGSDVGAELATPTGAALLTATVSGWGPQPAMRVSRQSFGAGGRDLPDRPNVVRLLVGEPAAAAPGGTRVSGAVLLEANVDDMDPRLWPNVLATLLDAGASDAWLVPILMKKGRPAHTLCVLADEPVAGRLREIIFAETSTIGVREMPATKHALARHERTVQVDGHEIRVKVAVRDGVTSNVQPEYDDVAAVAAATGRPPKDILAAALRMTMFGT